MPGSLPARKCPLAVIAIAGLLLGAWNGCGAQPTDRDGPSALDFLPALAGGYFELESAALGRPFHVYVSLPQSYDESNARYPVVYVLDGDSLFPVVAPMHLFLTIDEGLPEAIVVGIAYGSFDPSINKRDYDFTPAAVDSKPGQGGAAAFASFLKGELIPTVERRYRADPSRRILFGQSRGGGMVLFSAFRDPDLFWARIASNPTFDPGRSLFFSAPAPAARNDLALVVTSGSRDRSGLREAALQWFSAWEGAESLPWKLYTTTIEGGTHAAFAPTSYRTAMLWLFASGNE